MRVSFAPLLVIVCVALAGCGSERAAEATATRTPAANPSAEKEVAAVAVRYMRAIANEDWQAACASRVRSEQEDFADMAGNCPDAMEAMYSAKAFKMFASATAADVRIKGDLAGVDMVQPGRTKPFGKLAAVREDGQWLLKDIKDDEIP